MDTFLVPGASGSKVQLSWKNVALLLTLKCVFETVQRSEGVPVDLKVEAEFGLLPLF
jgi:hypothetical protein